MPKIIGITGSIGMGKSTIASMLSQIKIPVFDSDKEVARILKENSTVIIITHFLNDYYIINKKRKLFIKKHTNFFFVALDMPLLFETNTHKICHFIFLANTIDRVQRTRVLSRQHMTNAKFELIKKNQLIIPKRRPQKFVL